jgi:tRNA pseudouridine38-40 synthase
MRVKLVVGYDGSDFRGWAFQAGHRTVRGVLTEAFRRAVGEDIEVVGASRTDSGAHAKGQVCHFDTSLPIPTSKWPSILNKVLPEDLVVISAEEVSEVFHARFSAEDRFYRYRIRQGARDPFAGRYAHQHERDLDISLMKEAGAMLVGTHDFRAFTEELDPGTENTVRTMRSVEVYSAPSEDAASEIWLDIVGTAFLRGMMRRMAGALLEVGAGRRKLDSVRELLSDQRDQLHWPVVLPAKGLCLMSIRYSDPPRRHDLAK